MTHVSTLNPAESTTLSRWQSGLGAVVELEWLLASEVDVIVGGGIEDVFDPTYVNVRGVQVTTIPPLRLVAEVGVRARF
jgi:hypothetical protein